MYVDGRLAGVSGNVPFWSEVPAKFYIGNMAEWHFVSPHGYDEFRILDREITELEAAVDACREREFTMDDEGVRLRSFLVPIDISAVTKTPFEDQEANDKKGGWTDQGATNDMRNIPRGDLDIAGIPFRVENGCAVLANAQRRHYPEVKAGSLTRATVSRHPSLRARKQERMFTSSRLVAATKMSASAAPAWRR
jgi:hypothetical protein